MLYSPRVLYSPKGKGARSARALVFFNPGTCSIMYRCAGEAHPPHVGSSRRGMIACACTSPWVIMSRCVVCNASTNLSVSFPTSTNDGTDMHDWCATCIMLKVTAAQVNRLATPCALGLVWDCMRSHYKREARAIAKKETRRWYLIRLLVGTSYCMLKDATIFSILQLKDAFSTSFVEPVLTFLLGPETFLTPIDRCFKRDYERPCDDPGWPFKF